MRHGGLSAVVLAALLFPTVSAFAETSLDVLEQDLDQVKQDHETASSQATKNILSQLAAASASPAAALALYQQAGGLMPAPRPPPILPRNEEETPDQEHARLAENQQAVTRLAATLQGHCEVMEYAVLFATDPNQAGLHDQWIAWLQAVGPLYPQFQGTEDLRGRRDIAPADGTGSADATDSSDSTASEDSNSSSDTGGNGGNGGNRRRRYGDQQQQRQSELEPLGDWKTITMTDSKIGRYLGFHGWEGKEQADWAVSEIPKFYRTDILEPLRTTPTADTLAAWDVYIAMKNADQIEPTQWTQVDYPTLEFDRGCDAYAVKPSMEKLETLIGIIKAVPTHPKLDDMIARLKTLVADYRSHSANGDGTAQGSPAAAGGSATTSPNVSVETTSEGDMTVITTHTNAAPSSPVSPPQ